MTDAELGRQARVREVREATTEGGVLAVQVELYNSTAELERINYKFEWFDEKGMSIEAPTSGWRPKTLHGGEPVWIKAVAPSPRAKDFRLKLVEAG